MTDIKIDLSFLGPPNRESPRELIYRFMLKQMHKFYNQDEIMHRYGWAIKLAKINPQREMQKEIQFGCAKMTDRDLDDLALDIHDLSDRLESAGIG